MGEYARYNGEQIKMGTCEDMFYLRAEQAHLVTPVPNSLDPMKERAEIRFRFPWPDEDGTEPGAFEPFDRSVLVPYAKHAADDVFCDVHFDDKCKGQPDLVEISQQRYWKGKLVLVCRCGRCHMPYRLGTFKEAEPIIRACIDEYQMCKFEDPKKSLWWINVGIRILDGYMLKPKGRGGLTLVS